MNHEFTRPYLDQVKTWPREGRHILAHHNEENIVVYQAYRPAIGRHAAAHQRFGGEFSFSRMSWIKPNFLWMMYRSGWGTKEGQEITLGVTIPRVLFDEILASAVPSTFDSSRFESHDAWKQALETSDVRLQWDPDHGPDGAPQARRAIQLGLRGSMLRRYAADEVVKIEDISTFVDEQRRHASGDFQNLITPIERIYQPNREDSAPSINLDPVPAIVGR
ncbi:MAG TPA: DUF4291 domain-containing protein [Haloferula sp.]